MSVFESFKESRAKEELEKKLAQQKAEFENSIQVQRDENEYLKDQIVDLQKVFDKKGEKRITANRQLLLFHYLGFLDIHKFPSNEKKYDLLFYLIDKNRQSVKNFYNYRVQTKTDEFKKLFNEKDLKFVHTLFVEVGLSDIAKKVESDIIELKY